MYCYTRKSVRLACLIHAASVRSEPESNSPIENRSRSPQVTPRETSLKFWPIYYWPTKCLVTTSALSLHPDRHPRLRLSTRSRTVTRTIQSSFELLLSIVSPCPYPDKRTPRCKRTDFPADPKKSETEIKGMEKIRLPQIRSNVFYIFFS